MAERLLVLLLPAVVLLHLFLAPYTKVEESFNIQATHDILTYGIPWRHLFQGNFELPAQYDHLTFTGPVPRTFVGPLALAGASWPFIQFGAGKGGALGEQLIARTVLGLSNAFCMLCFRDGVQKAFGKNAANWYIIFQASQFHIMYYASRTLPNFFAFGLTTIALRKLLPYADRSPFSRPSEGRSSSALILLTIAGVVFRSEIAILLACHTIFLYYQPHILIPMSSIIPAGLIGAILGLALTVPIDSFFWQRFPLWPELTGFIYNIVNKQSLNWGVQSWHFYFTSALPRLLFNPLIYQLCIPFALSIPILRRPALDILIPNLAFVAFYSFQPHKEWRFIIYVVPPLLAVVSAGASWIWTRRAKNFVYQLLSLSLVASVLASFAASFAMLAVSRLNYPGADALNRLHALACNETGVVTVHMDTLSCMTGVTRFMELPPPVLGDEEGAFWVYDKTEDERKLLDPVFWEGFDYVLAERPERVIGSWEVLEIVYGYAGIGVVRPGEDMKKGAEWKVVEQICRRAIVAVREQRDFGRLGYCTRSVYGRVKGVARERVTRGWWVQMKMEPRIRILRREREKDYSFDPSEQEDPSHHFHQHEHGYV